MRPIICFGSLGNGKDGPMIRLVLAAIVLMTVSGCTTVVKDDSATVQRLNDLEKRVSALEARQAK
jgi:hypothetical protein